jgi:hypothetical protein
MAYNIDNMMTLEMPLDIHQLGMATIIHCTQFGFVAHWMIPHQNQITKVIGIHGLSLV